MNKPKPSLKIRTANAIFCIYLGIFRDGNGDLELLFKHNYQIKRNNETEIHT